MIYSVCKVSAASQQQQQQQHRLRHNQFVPPQNSTGCFIASAIFFLSLRLRQYTVKNVFLTITVAVVSSYKTTLLSEFFAQNAQTERI
jgi:hypothetical protein